MRQVPGLGDIPVLGALFRSSRWRRKETELVVLVTPRLVTAEESRALAPDPLRVSNEPSQIDLILGGLTFDQPMAAPVGGNRGPLPLRSFRASQSVMAITTCLGRPDLALGQGLEHDPT